MIKKIYYVLLAICTILFAFSNYSFCANVVTLDVSPKEIKVGDTVTITVTHIPEGTTGYEYVVTYDATILKTDADTDHNGSFKVANADLNANEIKTSKITFTALKAGKTELSLSDIDLGGRNGSLVNAGDNTSSSISINVLENTNEATTTNSTPEAKTTTVAKADTTKSKLKNAKTGFDITYVVYSLLAVLLIAILIISFKKKE